MLGIVKDIDSREECQPLKKLPMIVRQPSVQLLFTFSELKLVGEKIMALQNLDPWKSSLAYTQSIIDLMNSVMGRDSCVSTSRIGRVPRQDPVPTATCHLLRRSQL